MTRRHGCDARVSELEGLWRARCPRRAIPRRASTAPCAAWRRASARTSSGGCATPPPARRRSRAIPSGSLGLDRATGLGGLPRGHLTEFFGPESSGKTTLLYAALAAAQRPGGWAALVDAEGTADGALLAGAASTSTRSSSPAPPAPPTPSSC